MRVNVPGVGAVNFPDTMSPEEIKIAIERDILPRRAPKQDEAQLREQGARDALEGESWGSKALINFGAGVDSAVKGVQQLFGQGPSEAEIQDKRARDKVLADSTTGGTAMQIVGETLPTMAIPGSGFVKAGQVAMRAAPTVARLGTKAAAADAAIGGALSGAMQLTAEDESKLFNTVLGAVGGSAITGMLAGGRTVREILTRGGAEAKAARRLVEAAGGEQAAEVALAQMRNHRPGAVTRDIPMTAAELTQNPGLGRAERTAQARYAEDWAPFRQEQAQARYDALRRATDNDLEGVKAARRDATRGMRDEALESASQDKWFHAPIIEKLQAMRAGAAGADPAVQRLLSYVEGQVATRLPKDATEPAIFKTLDKAIAESPQPRVFSLVEQAAAELPNHGYRSPRPGDKMFRGESEGIIGGDFAPRHVPVPTIPAPVTDATPERLYRVRKVLLEKLNGKTQIGDDLSAAAKGRREETMQIVKTIDDAIDDASGGKWLPYLREYASKSGEVNSAEALALIRKSFEKANAPQFGGVPAVTGHRLGAAMEKHAQNSFGDKLTPQARAGLDELRGNVELSEGLQKLLKMTGTSGGGSNSAMDLTSLAAQKAVPAVAEVTPILGKLMKRSDEMTQAAMSDALRNPDLFIASVSKKLAQNRPLTRSEESVLLLLRSVGASEALALTQPQ